MTEDQINEAISEYYLGNKTIARQILLDVVEDQPANEEAWLLLSIYCESTEEKIITLGRVLSINPYNQTARDMLRQFTISGEADTWANSGLQTFTPAITRNPAAKNENAAVGPSQEALPFDVSRVRAQNPKTNALETRWYKVGIGFLGGAVLLWGIFIGLLIKGQGPGIIPVTGHTPTLIESHPVVALEITQTPTTTVTLTAVSTGTPTSLAGTQLTPTITLTASKTLQPTVSKTPTITVTSTQTLLPTATLQPSRTLIPTFTFTPTFTVSPTFQNQGGTQVDPIKPGNGYRFVGIGTMKVESSTWQPGQIGLAVLKLWFSCELPADEICATELFSFELVSSTSRAYPRIDDPSIPKPWFGSIINLPTYGGNSEEGYLGFSISSSEYLLLLRVGNTLEPGSEAYFELP